MADTLIGAIDIGGTKIAVGIVTAQGQVLAHQSFSTQPEQGPQASVQRIAQALITLTNNQSANLSGIGIGATGPVNPFTGRFGAVEFLTGWQDYDIIAALTAACGVPAALENDADAYALGEWRWGAGRGASPFIVVTVGTGIGVSLITAGQVYRGVDGAHPEIGHHIIDPSGPPCTCGAHGCWESLASGPAMEDWAARQSPSLPRRTGAELCAAALTGEPSALAAVQRTARYLGLGIANLVTLYAPQVLALSGGIMRSSELFLPVILNTVQATCAYVPKEKTRILVLESDALAGLRGAAQVWLSRSDEPKIE
ncbi:MAG: ROK family protein [Anaerolineaceae bacterium]|nr:ROK family protein [Anaerolineaceae bacterium]